MIRIFILSILICLNSNSQIILRGGSVRGGIIGQAPPPAPSATWTLIAHVGVQGSGSSGIITSPSINTVGANFIAFVADWSGGGPATGTTPAFPSDTVQASTTWTASNPKVQVFYVVNPTQSASYTCRVTVSGSSSTPNIYAYSFNKSSGTPALDNEAAGGGSANWGNDAPLSTGTVTVAGTDLVLTAAVWDVPTTTDATVSGGFTKFTDGPFYNVYGLQGAYLLDAITSQTPAWSPSPTSNADVHVIAISFK